MAREGARVTGRQEPLSERERELARARQVARPVKLLALIEKMEGWHVDDDVITAVLEAAEAGVSIDRVYEGPQAEVRDATVEEEEEARPEARQPARAIGVHRLGEGSILHFGRDGLPANPPVKHFFLSDLDAEHCYACELLCDPMIANLPPYFARGDILVFSTEEKPRSGDFALVKTKTGDRFTQVFFGREDTVRLRPLNGKYPEETYKRHELKEIHRLVARYHKFPRE